MSIIIKLTLILFSRIIKLFYFNKLSNFNWKHSHHLKLHEQKLVRGAKDVPADTLDLINNLLQRHCPLSVAQQLLELSCGNKLPRNSLAKLREAVLMRKYQTNGSETTAETLIRLLNNDDNISCVCCTGSYDEAKQLVKVNKKRKSRGKNITNDQKKNISNQHERFVKEVILGLQINNCEFLISVMWVDEIAKRYHQLYPDVLGADVTHRTNAEKRGLWRACSKHLDQRNLPNVFCFVPSAQS